MGRSTVSDARGEKQSQTTNVRTSDQTWLAHNAGFEQVDIIDERLAQLMHVVRITWSVDLKRYSAASLCHFSCLLACLFKIMGANASRSL